MVVFDTATLLLLIDPESKPPTDPATGALTIKCKQRIELLVKQLDAAKIRVLLPTPVIAEFLVRAGPNKIEYLEEFLRSTSFKPTAFDVRAAIEVAHLQDADLKSGEKIDQNESKAKVKFDRQVVAIAKVEGATTIYTDDRGLANTARNNGLKVVPTWELPLPPEDPQLELGISDGAQSSEEKKRPAK